MDRVLSGKIGVDLKSGVVFDAHTVADTLLVFVNGVVVLKLPTAGDKGDRGKDLLAKLQKAFGGNPAPSATQP